MSNIFFVTSQNQQIFCLSLHNPVFCTNLKIYFFIIFFQFPTKMMVRYELAINSKKYRPVYYHSNNSQLSLPLAHQLKCYSHAASSSDSGLRVIYMTGQDVAILLGLTLVDISATEDTYIFR